MLEKSTNWAKCTDSPVNERADVENRLAACCLWKKGNATSVLLSKEGMGL